MNEVHLLPVFPLTLSVCPGERVPLHIFEPRFKAMIAWCRAESQQGRPGEFVIVLSAEERWWPVGCAMRVAKVLQEYEDGRLDLVAVGHRRCAVEQADSDAPYPVGRIAPLEDASTDWDEKLANDVFLHHRRLMALVTGKEPDASDYAGLTSLSYHVMPMAGLGLRKKQELLELPSENDRLRALSEHLRETIDMLLRAHEAVNTIQTALKANALLRG